MLTQPCDENGREKMARKNGIWEKQTHPVIESNGLPETIPRTQQNRQPCAKIATLSIALLNGKWLLIVS